MNNGSALNILDKIFEKPKSDMDFNELKQGLLEDQDYEDMNNTNKDIFQEKKVKSYEVPVIVREDLYFRYETLFSDIDCFVRDDNFENNLVIRRENDYFICGRIYVKSYSYNDKVNKLNLDIKLKHKQIPPLIGFDSSNDGSVILEIRKIDFEPFPISNQVLLKATRVQLFKIISQFIDFVNYISSIEYSVTLLTLYDLFSSCFIDNDFNLFFGDLSFIEVGYDYHKNLFSIGIIVYQLLGNEISIEDYKAFTGPVFNEDIPHFWKNYISQCLKGKVNFNSFNSTFMHKKSENIDDLFYNNDSSDNELEDIEEIIVEVPKQKKKKEIGKVDKSILDNYQHIRMNHLDSRRDSRFIGFQAEISEDGKSVFIEKIEESLIELSLSKFKKQIEIIHPIIIPLIGFICTDPTLKTIYIYRKSDKMLRPANSKNISSIPIEIRLKGAKKLADFTFYIINETIYKMNTAFLTSAAALDEENNIFLANLEFIDNAINDEEAFKSCVESYWVFFNDYFEDNSLVTINLPIKIRNILTKSYFDRDFGDLCIMKTFIDNYNQNFNPIESDVKKYLEDYAVESEIEGHQCHIKVYKRNILSNKKYKRLVLKRYGFVISNNLKKILIKVKEEERDIIEVWTTEKETFILMKFIKAFRLGEIIPNLDYDNKIIILKNMALLIKKYLMSVIFCNISIDNVYIDKDFQIKLLDCIFVVDDTKGESLPPEVAHLSTIKKYEIEKVDIFSMGIIAYEMFGRKYDSQTNFDFDNIPQFIHYFVRVCCNKKVMERPSIFSLIEKLEKYQEHDIEKLFRNDLIEIAPYYIDQSDINKSIEKFYSISMFVRQKSTNKFLFIRNMNPQYGQKGTELIRCAIQAARCRNSYPLYGFSFGKTEYIFLYEYTSTKYDNFYEFDVNLDIIKMISQFYADMFNFGYIIDIYETYMIINQDNIPKFFPNILFCRQLDYDTALKEFAKVLLSIYCKDEETSEKSFSPDIHPIIQVIYWRIMTNKTEKKEKITFSMISKIFEKMDDSFDTEWNEENNGEILLYESNKRPDLVEEAIRVEIIMKCSNLSSYSRKDNKFQLVYHGNPDLTFMKHLYSIENLSATAFKKLERLKNYEKVDEYKGSHCLVQYYEKGEDKLVLKKYYKNPKNLITNASYWEKNNELYVLQKYEDVETLDERLKHDSAFFSEEIIQKLIYEMLDNCSRHYNRFSPHNICISQTDDEIKIVDTICLNSSNYEDFKDGFIAPECSKLDDFNKKERDSAIVYSVGWTACFLFGLLPEIDPITKRFKPPVFTDGFPKFWRDFITLSTRENTIDRPGKKYLIDKMNLKSPFEEYDFILVSSKLLKYDDYVIENPIGAGGEATIYLSTNKITGQKHACKKLKYKIRSTKIKQMLFAMEKLNNIINGIKYIGISEFEEKVFLHMEYVPNGSLNEIISLDKRMMAPSWFKESSKLRIAREIAEGMRSMHDQGIVHKDLKPENILLDENNSVKICDFSFIPEEGAATPLFMAPELFNNQEAAFKSDVYAFSVTLATLYGGGEMIGSVKTASSGGFRPSIAAGTPSLIQILIMKCWQQNPDDRPTFNEIVVELYRTDPEEFDFRLDSMEEFKEFDLSVKKGVLSNKYEYEICDITGDCDDVEHMIRLYMTIQPDNIIHIHKYCRLGDKIVLVLERSEKLSFDLYLGEKKKVSQSRGEKYVSDFISLFELYHKNKFHFGPFSLKRLFFRDRHRSSICFDLFMIPGLNRPNVNEQALVSPPEGFYSREADIFAFSCFVLKIFGCLSFDNEGNVIKKPFKRSSRSSKQPIPFKYQNIIMERCLSKEPMTRPTFELLFQKLFPVQYKIISTFLSVSVSRFSTFSMKNDFKQEEIVFMETLGSGTFGSVMHAFNKTNNQDLAVKEFNDASHGAKNEDFMLEYVALKAIDHPNIVKILGATQRKEQVHGSRLFMEFASSGDLEKNIDEPFEIFIVQLLQISSAMKYLHQRGIIHFDLKPKNILIRGDGSAVVADFNTAMHVDIDTHLRNQRGSEDYMPPEIKNGEKYSYSTDVFSFGLLAAEYFSCDSNRVVREANDKHEHPVLEFIPYKSLRSLIEFCVDDDPMSRPSFDFICSYIFKKFIKDTPRADELEKLTLIHRIDEDKLNQLRVLASRGSNEAIVEYGRYLLCENSFNDAMHVFLKGANNDDASCQNTIGVLSKTKIAEKIVDDGENFIIKSAEQGDKYGLTNMGKILYKEGRIIESIEALESTYSKGVSFAGYLLGLIYEENEIKGISINDKISKAVKYYHDAAQDGDAFAQYKYGCFIEDGTTTDDEGFDCVHYFRQSAYQRCCDGCVKYSKFLEGDLKEFYHSFIDLIPREKTRLLWADEEAFFEEMMSCHIGSLLFDDSSREKFENYEKNIFEKTFR